MFRDETDEMTKKRMEFLKKDYEKTLSGLRKQIDLKNVQFQQLLQRLYSSDKNEDRLKNYEMIIDELREEAYLDKLLLENENDQLKSENMKLRSELELLKKQMIEINKLRNQELSRSMEVDSNENIPDNKTERNKKNRLSRNNNPSIRLPYHPIFDSHQSKQFPYEHHRLNS
ncbi:hypothetical protein SNEBB_005272 [Seison nebaliae]|nr:hypothetical protein SNEBB_005272 [Seison nebaliae]